MRNPKVVVTIVLLALLAAGLAGFVGLGAYAGSDNARASLLVRYFRAVASGDPLSVEDLTAGSFESDLGIGPLSRGSYELYDFGEQSDEIVRFMIVVDTADGGKRAILGDLVYRRVGISNRVVSIRRVDEGTGLQE